MNNFLRCSFCLLLVGLFSATYAQAATTEVLVQSTSSWDGTAIYYPKGDAQISVMRIIISPGETMEFHCHPVPSAAYLVAGDLEVRLKSGNKRAFHAGDVITEVVHTIHQGANLSATQPVELIAFYAGSTGQAITLHAEQEGCHL